MKSGNLTGEMKQFGQLWKYSRLLAKVINAIYLIWTNDNERPGEITTNQKQNSTVANIHNEKNMREQNVL